MCWWPQRAELSRQTPASAGFTIFLREAPAWDVPPQAKGICQHLPRPHSQSQALALGKLLGALVST